jgi:uncharacterized membrane protein YkvA (DUF1232 family)
MGKFIEPLKQQARKLKIETYALYLAIRDPRVPLLARIFAGLVVGYAFSPIDLIPDFVPILGYIDDLILVPLGIKIAISMIPKNVMMESREKAQDIIRQGKPVNRVAALIIIMIWLALAILCIALIIHRFKR